MIPKAAIEKAIEGGWVMAGDFFSLGGVNDTSAFYFRRNQSVQGVWLSEIALDPTFWQALGKALGWQKQPYLCEGCQTIGSRDRNHMNACPIKMRYGNWDDEARRLYNLILTGADTQIFWDELLS